MVYNMEDRDLIQELMAQVREIADGQIRIEGKLDVIKLEYTNNDKALEARIELLEKKEDKKDEQKTWLVRTILGQFIVIVFGIIALYYKTKG